MKSNGWQLVPRIKMNHILCILALSFAAFAGAVNYSYDAAGRLILADYGGGKTIAYTYDKAGNLLSRVAGPVTGPAVNAVVNGASFASGGIVPGEIATIFGTNLTSSTGINLTSTLPLPPVFLNVSVIINGAPVPLFAVDNVNGQQQINFQVPWELAGKPTATVAVSNGGALGAAITVPVLTGQPGIFNYSASGGSFGAILHANFQLADTAHPAAAGEIVLIYCTGLGAVTSPPSNGAPASGEPTVVTPIVMIGGVKADVSFSGLAPGFVGLYQINAQIPPSLSSGNQSVIITAGGVSSNSALVPVK